MSTRSTTHFKGYGGETTAVIYRHCDGYISCAGSDLLAFLAEIEEAGTVGGSGLASAYVAWAVKNDIQAEIMAADPGDIEYRYTVERVGKTGAHYRVMVDQRSPSCGRWNSYELTADLVAAEVADFQRRAAEMQRS